ncbi:MAG: hypothetical protein GXO99_01380 [Nitrospirae bacterium]|nr:hypothetical protein [Nitrospirota bacterium]
MKSLKIIISILVLVIALYSFAVAATENSTSEVEYSADMIFVSDQISQRGKLYYTPLKERREYTMKGMKQVMIIRRDKGKVWILMPDVGMYMERPLNNQNVPGDMSNVVIEESKPLGKELVNGVMTTKYKLIMTMPGQGKVGGFFWKTKDGITVKMFVVSKFKDGIREDKARMKMELKNLKLSRQPSSLFEIPPGYNRMPMGMPGMGRPF